MLWSYKPDVVLAIFKQIFNLDEQPDFFNIMNRSRQSGLGRLFSEVMTRVLSRWVCFSSQKGSNALVVKQSSGIVCQQPLAFWVKKLFWIKKSNCNRNLLSNLFIVPLVCSLLEECVLQELCVSTWTEVCWVLSCGEAGAEGYCFLQCLPGLVLSFSKKTKAFSSCEWVGEQKRITTSSLSLWLYIHVSWKTKMMS